MSDAGWNISIGDACTVLSIMQPASVHCVVTSPPYWGLRDYGVEGQIGLEESPEAFVAKLIDVFREVRRVLRDDGTCWVNLGDCYSGATGGYQGKNGQTASRGFTAKSYVYKTGDGLKNKDLVGIPWMVAFALRSDGWWLRSEIIWHKPNAMPEGVRDRPTKSHEQLFLFTKSERYLYDCDAIRDPLREQKLGANKRTVWTIPTRPFDGDHFATFPPDLVKPCILAGCPVGGVVLDPFAGAGTTGLVALRLQRKFEGIELNPAYADMARKRIIADSPLFNIVGNR